MAVGAHPDDNEIIAGTLAMHKKTGWRVVSVVMTDGMYIDGKAAKENIPIRERETIAAAEVIGSIPEFLHFKEGEFQPTEESRYALTRLIRKYAPEIIITHPPEDYHMDHISTSRCTREALHLSWNPTVEPETPVCAMPKLYYADPWFVPFTPDEYVDITGVFEQKIKAYSCHKSQLNNIGRNEGSLIGVTEIRDQYRGIEAGVKYAEAFQLVPTFGSVRLTKLLG